MNNNILPVLEDLGLSKNEAKVYLTMLGLGTSTATKIAQKSTLHRPNVYDSVKGLVEKGLASTISIDGTKQFRAVNPDHLSNLIKQKEIALMKVLPTLKLEAELSQNKCSFAEVYSGIKAFRSRYYALLEYGKPFYAFGIPNMVPKVVGSFIEHFHKNRIERKIPFSHIYNADVKARIDYLNSLPYTSAVHLDARLDSPVTTIICGPEILIVRWEPLSFIRIVDESLSESYYKYFQTLLKFSKAD